MKIAERLIRKLRYNGRIAAGVEAVAIIEQGRVQLLLRNPFGRAHGTLHLVINNAVHAELTVVYLVVPALLPEYFGNGVQQRVEHRVKIYLHKVQKVLCVLAGDGIHGHVARGHGVEECVERALHQLHKRLPHGVFAAAGKRAVLQYVRHAGAVFRRRAEAYAKRLVRVIALKVRKRKAAFFVLIYIGPSVYFLKLA